MSDIDNTVVDELNRPIPLSVHWLRAASHHFDIMFLTGRHAEKRRVTEDLLRKLRIPYSELFMDERNIPYGKQGESGRAAMKARVIRNLLKTYDVVLFVDDSKQNRAAVKDLGVETKKPWNLTRDLLDGPLDK